MPTTVKGLRPICYMVMPFRRKPVEEPRPAGAPAEIDFDALWERAYLPAIDAMGYLPMRADFDPSSAIVKAMLERIAFADLVIADVTIGNGNCYYELGVRHVAQQTHCVLVAPDWVRPLFDIAQFASVRFPLVDGTIPEAEAAVIRERILRVVPGVRASRTPYYELLGDSVNDGARRSAFRDFAEQLAAFQARVKALRALSSDPAECRARLNELITSLPPTALEIPEVAIDLVSLTRDIGGWPATVAFIDSLAAPIRRLAWIEEQYALAVAKVGDPASAIGLLEALIERSGETPERRGLIGGRYKQLWQTARQSRLDAGQRDTSADERRHLGSAIQQYTRGMELDLNAYYCSSNLPALLRERARKGDEARAEVIEQFILGACNRAHALGTGDEWLRPTLLGAAFRAADVERAEELALDVEQDGAAAWRLASTLKDVRLAVDRTRDESKREQLESIYGRLLALLPP